MAEFNLTYQFGNNFENEASSAAVSVPAMVVAEGIRNSTPAVYLADGDTVVSFTIPANCIIQNFYLVVEEAMTGTVGVTLDDGANTEVFPITTAIDAVDVVLSDLFDVYVTTPYNLVFTFAGDQSLTPDGTLKIAFDYIQLDTNTAKYINK